MDLLLILLEVWNAVTISCCCCSPAALNTHSIHTKDHVLGEVCGTGTTESK